MPPVHVLFLAPEHPPPHRDFVHALKQVGAWVSGIGHQPPEALDGELRGWLDAYEQVGSLFDREAVAAAGRRIAQRAAVGRVEAVDEMLVLAAAHLRRALGVAGLSVEAATLCRDKTAMKDALRAAGIPCAASAAVASPAEARDFAERVGYPLVLKPRGGLGSQGTYRVDGDGELEAAAQALGVDRGESAAIEEFVVGHEGFYDALAVGGEVHHEFICHYFPNVLEAMRERTISPQIAATNRVDSPAYGEVRRLGRQVVRLLEIGTSAAHMEWFHGPHGLRFSEIGARPPGERLWDLHCAGNDLDLYREWALAVTTGRTEATTSRRYATGSVQVRPERDGRIAGHEGLDEVWRRCQPWIFRYHVPRPGTPTRPLRLGYLENTWFRLRHPDYDELLRLLSFIGENLKVRATAE
jgi:Carbamoyl-phosphate synthase L chain, ATP binding domain